MKPRILVSREVLSGGAGASGASISRSMTNQADVMLGAEGLKARLADKAGALTAATEPHRRRADRRRARA